MKPSKANPGDYIEIHLTRKIYEGTLLEAPETEKGIVLLKLDNGYNIGFNKKDILEIKLIEKAKKENETDNVQIKKSPEKPNIAMIITGGTIASRLDPKTGGVKPLETPEDLFKFYPSIFEKVNVSKIEIPFMKASEDMDFKDWQKLARLTTNLLNDANIKGVIITHGTDTLHYTSAALSFFLRDLNKPVVLTYSQRSIDRASSDAELNLQCSVLAAISDIAEVMLVGHASSNDDFCYVMPGVKVRKLHSSRRDAFKIVNGKPIAKITRDGIQILREYNKRSKGNVKADLNFEEKIALIKFYPGQNPEILNYYLKNKYKGIVLEVLGLGHISTKPKNWIKKIKELINKGIVVCAAAQTIYGRLDPWVYSNGRELMNAGVIFLEDMLSETAFVKLGYVLAKTTNKEEVKKLMLTNIAGEISDRLEE